MAQWKSIADIRREYGELTLSSTQALDAPFEQFELWFNEVLETEHSDPTAMVLSTVDESGLPDSRVVLLKGISEQGLIFYTNYLSAKGIQLGANPCAAVNFYWPQMARQVRVRGRVKKLTTTQSDEYFASRPQASQISAVASPQSKDITGREELEQRMKKLIEEYGTEPIVRPQSWGGYVLLADEFEFWQGRDNRLHDRIHYFQQNGAWEKRCLAP